MSISRASAPVIRSGFPRAGSLSGTQKRREFIAAIQAVCGDVVRLYVPTLGDGASITESSRNAATITAVATPTYSPQGSGVLAVLNGTSQYYTMPDAADMSFVSLPFSIFAWLNLTANAAVKTILARHDLTTGVTNLEWSFHLDAAEKLVGQCFDDSVGTDVRIGRTFNTALAADTPMLVVMTYDGLAVNAAVRLYVFDGTNAGKVDDTDAGSGAFVAMENKSGLTYIGAREAASGAATEFFSGSIGPVGLVAMHLDVNDIQAIRGIGNAFLQLTV